MSASKEWLKQVDEGNNVFFYNTKTGATQWEAPSGYLDNLGKDWVEALDESGALYYYNIVSGEASWDHPGGPEAAADAAAGTTAQNTAATLTSEASDDMPEWSRMFDPSTKMYYYVNNRTLESRWDEPEGFKAIDFSKAKLLMAPEVKAAVLLQSAFRAKQARRVVRVERAKAKTDEQGSVWVEMLDPSSGYPYYFNTETNEVTWEKPADLNHTEPSSDAKSDLKDGSLPLPSDQIPSQESENTMDADPEKKPQEDTELKETSISDESIKTTEASKSSETVQTPAQTPAQNDKDIRDSTKMESNAANQVHNEVDEAKEKSKKEEIATAKTEPKSQKNSAEDPTSDSTEPEELPEWIEVFDPQTKLYYFFNNKTFESQWDQPEGFHRKDFSKAKNLMAPELRATLMLQCAFRAHKARRAVRAQRGFVNAAENKSGQDWQKLTDPKTKSVYYYNRKTQETSWKVPEGYVSDTSENNTDVKDISPGSRPATASRIGSQAATEETEENEKEEEEEEEEEEEDLDEELPEWIQVFDPQTKLYYYFNNKTLESQWDEPENFERKDFTKAKHLMAPELRAAIMMQCVFRAKRARRDVRKQRGKTMSVSSPNAESKNSDENSPWQAILDPKSGNMYYFNQDTEEVTWDKPTDLMSDEERKLAEEASKSPQWYTAVAKDTGDVYFYNIKTGEVSWDKPKDFDGDGSILGDNDERLKKVRRTLMLAMDGQLKKRSAEMESRMKQAHEEQARAMGASKRRWLEVYDEKHQAFYYYDVNTHETVWEKPEDFVMQSSDELLQAALTMQGMFRARIARNKTRVLRAIQATKDKPPQEPPLWVKLADKESKTDFWFHKVTHQISWDQPPESKLEESEDPIQKRQELEKKPHAIKALEQSETESKNTLATTQPSQEAPPMESDTTATHPKSDGGEGQPGLHEDDLQSETLSPESHQSLETSDPRLAQDVTEQPQEATRSDEGNARDENSEDHVDAEAIAAVSSQQEDDQVLPTTSQPTRQSFDEAAQSTSNSLENTQSNYIDGGEPLDPINTSTEIEQFSPRDTDVPQEALVPETDEIIQDRQPDENDHEAEVQAQELEVQVHDSPAIETKQLTLEERREARAKERERLSREQRLQEEQRIEREQNRREARELEILTKQQEAREKKQAERASHLKEKQIRIEAVRKQREQELKTKESEKNKRGKAHVKVKQAEQDRKAKERVDKQKQDAANLKSWVKLYASSVNEIRKNESTKHASMVATLQQERKIQADEHALLHGNSNKPKESFVDIFEAIRAGVADVTILKKLVPKGCELVDLRNNMGKSVLHEACWLGLMTTTQELLNLADHLDSDGAALLAQAVDSCCSLTTPLHEVARAGWSRAFVDILVKAGANVDARDHLGDTPLHCAARHGHYTTVKALIEADPSLETLITKNYKGSTALDLAEVHYKRKGSSVLQKKEECGETFVFRGLIKQTTDLLRSFQKAAIAQYGPELKVKRRLGKKRQSVASSTARSRKSKLYKDDLVIRNMVPRKTTILKREK